MQIKLLNIINELEINNPNPSWEEVYDYYRNNILYNDNEFGAGSKGWEEYEKIENYYSQKQWFYGLDKTNFKKLSQPDLNKFYRELKQLVKKYNLPYNPDNDDDVLAELEIDNPNKTAEEVYDYFIQNIWDNYNEFGVSTKGWEGYVKIRNKYNISNPKYKYDYQKLSQSDLNKLYNEMKQLVKKYATNNI